MTNTATMTYTASQIIENIQNKVEVIRKREAARKSALRRMISFLFNCEAHFPSHPGRASGPGFFCAASPPTMGFSSFLLWTYEDRR